MAGRGKTLWLLWTISTLSGAIVLTAGMLYGGGTRSSFLIGSMTDGHHQIGLACEACHQTPFGGRQAIQKACVGCHAADLAKSKDSHPAKKFTDPRNADRLAKLEATQCVTCHTEHKPRVTSAMGVTLPTDYCALCHQDIGKDRPTHVNVAFNTCTSAGCHNYHDNRALYEDFLEKHAKDPEIHPKPIIKLRSTPPRPERSTKPIVDGTAADAPRASMSDGSVVNDWLADAHSKAGVNCSGCHAPRAKDREQIEAQWNTSPDHSVCATCHKAEVKTFTEGKHGMRLATGLLSRKSGPFGLFGETTLGPMRPEHARIPMGPDATGKALTCTTCHSAHAFDTKNAEVKACLGCHDDQHSRSYLESPHHKLWQAEESGKAAKGTGVTCATCHMPRETREDPDSGEFVLSITHNQNANLRPNEKMIRSACMSCHGLGFTLDALADRQLISRNFTGRPSVRVKSIEWIMQRLKDREGRSAQPAGAK